jgi:hypothetical protein
MMVQNEPINRYRLNHQLNGRMECDHCHNVGIPICEQILVKNWDHNSIESLIEWGTFALLVEKDLLITFAEPLDGPPRHK